MNHLAQIIETAAAQTRAAIGITIIYEDRVTGLRAKRFSDMLVASFCGEHSRTPACWRLQLVDLPEIAEEIAHDAAASEFVILSLRGNSSLSMAARAWIESWLASAADSAASLVVLCDSSAAAEPRQKARAIISGTSRLKPVWRSSPIARSFRTTGDDPSSGERPTIGNAETP